MLQYSYSRSPGFTLPITHAVRRPEADGKTLGRQNIPKPRTGHPSLGRGQPRANRTGRQRHPRLPSTPRRGGGNAEFGCRDGRRRQGAGAVFTDTPSDCGSRREGFQPSVSLPAIGFHNGVQIASRIPCVRAAWLRPGGNLRNIVAIYFFLALVVLVWALGARIHTARKIKAESVEVDVRYPPHPGNHVKAR